MAFLCCFNHETPPQCHNLNLVNSWRGYLSRPRWHEQQILFQRPNHHTFSVSVALWPQEIGELWLPRLPILALLEERGSWCIIWFQFSDLFPPEFRGGAIPPWNSFLGRLEACLELFLLVKQTHLVTSLNKSYALPTLLNPSSPIWNPFIVSVYELPLQQKDEMI